VLLNYHIGRFVLVSLCVGDLVRLGLRSIRVADFSLLPARLTVGIHPNIFDIYLLVYLFILEALRQHSLSSVGTPKYACLFISIYPHRFTDMRILNISDVLQQIISGHFLFNPCPANVENMVSS